MTESVDNPDATSGKASTARKRVGRPPTVDLKRRSFGRLTVLHRLPGSLWHCVCSCGSTKDISCSSLTSGRTRSCGCLRRERSSEKAVPVAERFRDKVAKADAGCWLWTAGLNDDGYGVIAAKRELGEHLAHRVSWVLAFGPVPAGLQVLHKCDTPACVRPDHLFLGTQSDNIGDMNRKGRRRGPVGAAHPRTHLTESDVAEIRAATGSLREIGARFGLSISGVHAIKERKCWRHVP